MERLEFVTDNAGKPLGINQVIGHLDQALDAALVNGWTVVDMKNDWKIIHPYEKQKAK